LGIPRKYRARKVWSRARSGKNMNLFGNKLFKKKKGELVRNKGIIVVLI